MSGPKVSPPFECQLHLHAMSASEDAIATPLMETSPNIVFSSVDPEGSNIKERFPPGR